MPSPSNKSNYRAPAGILALNDESLCSLRPHATVLEAEVSLLVGEARGFLTAVKRSLETLVKIGASFYELNSALKAGYEYMFLPCNAIGGWLPLNEIRQEVYGRGKTSGFDKTLKLLNRSGEGAVSMISEVCSKSHYLEILRTTQALEQRRSSAATKLVGALFLCARMLEQHKVVRDLLDPSITKLGIAPDVRQFRKNLEELGKAIRTWNESCKTAHQAFNPALIESYHVVPSQQSALEELSNSIGDAFSLASKLAMLPSRKAQIASSVVAYLDRVSDTARKTVQREAPLERSVYRVLFLLRELEKELPPDVAADHQATLSSVTEDLISRGDLEDFLSTIANDTRLQEEDRELLINHIAPASESQRTHDEATSKASSPPESRRQIKRMIREGIRTSAIAADDSLLNARIEELRGANAEQALCPEAVVRYYPPRVETELEKWLVAFPQYIRDLVQERIRSVTLDPESGKALKREPKISELRIHEGGGIRIYLTRGSRDELFILAFGNKRSQEMDIDLAIQRYREIDATLS